MVLELPHARPEYSPTHAELILRGIKTVEYCSRLVSERITGKQFYIYAAKKPGDPPEGPRGFRRLGCKPGDAAVPVGVIVGTAAITRCVRKGPKDYE